MRRSMLADLAIFALAILVGPSCIANLAQAQTGEAVNDASLANQIRNGSPQMPGFGGTLKDSDIADLIAYLHDKCCYEETNPPANPWYRATAQNSPEVPLRGNLRGGPRGSVH